MKKIYLFLLLILIFGNLNAQATGIFESYAVLNINNSGNTYYDLQATTGNADFQGTDLGTFNSATQTIVFVGGENKTWKNGGADVTGGRIHYRVYSGTPTGSFSNVNFGFIQDLGGGDQKWGSTAGTTNILSGLPVGNYTLEVYTESDTNLGARFSNNSGANYKATFTVSSNLAVDDINKSKAKSFFSEGKLYTSQKGNLEIQVFDFSGKSIKKLNTTTNSNGLELNLPQKGNYLVKINNEVLKIAY